MAQHLKRKKLKLIKVFYIIYLNEFSKQPFKLGNFYLFYSLTEAQ